MKSIYYAYLIYALGAFFLGQSITSANDIYVEDDTYFVITPDSTSRAKFQIRLRAPIFSENNQNIHPSLHNFNLFYNQKSFWEIGEPSAPFSEHNFNPGTFYMLSNLYDSVKYQIRSVSVAAGFEHISNGLDEENSRSLNRVFAAPVLRLVKGHLDVSARIWAYTGDTEPEDLHKYWGYGKVGITINSCADYPERAGRLKVSYQPGSDFDYYGYSCTFSMPVSFFGFNPSLVFDWWYGYGERLLTLEEKENIFRVGIGFQVPGEEANSSLMSFY